MLVYHIAKFVNLEAIQRQGLRSNMPSTYEHVGSGIYVFFDKRYYNTMSEYINAANNDEYGLALVITIEVNENDLLMDEDALIIDETHELEQLRSIMPQKAYVKYTDFLDNVGGSDIPAIESPHFGKWKTDLIDKFKIRPNSLFKVSFGHYNILTARCPFGIMDPVSIEIIFEGELRGLEELDRIMVAVQMED